MNSIPVSLKSCERQRLASAGSDVPLDVAARLAPGRRYSVLLSLLLCLDGAGALLVGSKRKHPTSRGDAPATPAPLLITPSVLHRRKSRPKKSPVGDH